MITDSGGLVRWLLVKVEAIVVRILLVGTEQIRLLLDPIKVVKKSARTEGGMRVGSIRAVSRSRVEGMLGIIMVHQSCGHC